VLSPEAFDFARLVWLQRPDLRAGAAVRARLPQPFMHWWQLHLRELYPAWAAHIPVDYAMLLRPLKGQPRFGPFAASLALRTLLDLRADLREAFDANIETGYRAALAWFYVHGLRELRLQDVLPAAQLQALDETPAFLAAAGADNALQRPLTWLMYFTWLSDPNLRARFDLTTPWGQAHYQRWFLSEGANLYGVLPLLHPRWRQWLLAALDHQGPTDLAVPRMAILLWKHRDELRQAFDLRTLLGFRRLVAWAQLATAQEPALQWLREDAAPKPAVKQSPNATRKRAAAPKRPFGLNLVGFAFGQLGIGEDVRMAVAACEAAGIPFKVVNMHPGNSGVADRALQDHVAADEDADPAPYAINVFCLTGFETARAYLEQGQALFAGRYNIGWWPWELPVWPRDWDLVFGLVDEVWAATRFTEAMYSDATARAARAAAPLGILKGARLPRVPVTFMPMPASVARVQPMTRKQLQLPARRFLFLYVFDFNSYLQRKHPFAAIEAFRKAFADDDRSVGLVLKTMNSKPDDPQWRRFLKACAADPRIVLIDRTLDRGEVLGLIQACDAYVSLHRSEGFGRTLAEAMLFGKPVVGTDFSGNVDFLNEESGFPVRWRQRAVEPGEYPFVTERDGPWWAQPSVADAARQLRAAREVSGNRAFAKQVRGFAAAHFDPARSGTLMRERLRAINAEWRTI